jgi:hypothetical protein
MKRSSGRSLYNSPLPFNKPFGIETAAIDNLTNLVATADPILTHSEVFIAGTEPLPPAPGVSGTIALAAQPQLNPSLAEKESAQRTGNIVLISNTQGRKVYVNAGPLFSSDPNPNSRPLGTSPPSGP